MHARMSSGSKRGIRQQVFLRDALRQEAEDRFHRNSQGGDDGSLNSGFRRNDEGAGATEIRMSRTIGLPPNTSGRAVMRDRGAACSISASGRWVPPFASVARRPSDGPQRSRLARHGQEHGVEETLFFAGGRVQSR